MLQYSFILGNQICARGQVQPDGSRADSCRGDSGGALLATNDQETVGIGVVSFGSRSCSGSIPGVYTNMMEEENLNWVLTQLGRPTPGTLHKY